MAGRRAIQNRLVERVPREVQYFADQYPTANRHRLTGFQVDLNLMARRKLANAGNQFIHLVVRTRDVVPTPKVDPIHARQQVAKLFLHRCQGAGQWREVVFAQRVKVQTTDTLEAVDIQLRTQDAESRTWRTRVIDGYIAL